MAVIPATPSRTAYFGEEGSFAHVVAMKRFPKHALTSCRTVDDAFAGLLEGTLDHAVVPIENATSGMITPTVDQIIQLARAEREDIAVREALTLTVRLALLGRGGRKAVTAIYSHPAPFFHARAWLKKHYPDARQVSVNSTSEAARRAKRQSGTAAIAGVQAADLYGLEVLHPSVGSEVRNQTTFYVVGQPLRGRRPATRTALVLELPHKAGSLVGVLQALAKEGINLTKIESRPIPGRFSEYRFLIECEGPADSSAFQKARRRCEKIASFLAMVGSYPVRAVR